MKHLAILTLHFSLLTLHSSAAVPLHWTVESSRTSLAQLEAYHGETLDIAATMQTYGKPLSLDGKTAVLYYQTNGMEQAWWSVNGTCSGSTARVTFTPAMDPGASILNLFLSVQDGGNNYRAHARLKMLGSPGADAHVIEPPIVTLDFSRIGIILNAPYYTKAEVDELVEDAGKVKTVAGQEPDASGNVSLSPSTIGAASSEDVQTLNLGYQRLYSFSTGATNANISVTNYPPTAADAEGRTHYDPNDPDLDFSTVPASMRLDEKRDGEKRTVVDTRDWPVWYFDCKLPRILAAAQEYAHTAYTNALAHLSAWADRTARGLENPAGESTLVIDVPNIWLMTDQTFEKHVSGSSSCWVIRSKNSAISPNVTTNGFLELTDAFGTPYIRFNKTEATFADPPASGIYHDDQEGEWIITYETTTKPKGGANLALQGSETYPGKAILKEEGDELCPAVITWTGSSGHWLMHAKPKQIAGADPNKMFFGAVVEVEGQDYIEYLKPVSFSHLVMPNGKKIAPDVPASASVGTIVNWKVVQ